METTAKSEHEPEIILLGGKYSVPPTHITGLPPKGEYIKQLLSREEETLLPAEATALSEANIAFFGIGSVGGNLAKQLAALGAGTNGVLRLIDMDTFDITNLNRQEAGWKDVVARIPKTQGIKNAILQRNPYAHVITHDNGIDISEIEAMIENCDLAVWGLDDTELAYELHKQAIKHGKPVYSSLDLGEWGMNRWWPYNKKGSLPFNGLINDETFRTLKANKIAFLAQGIHNLEDNMPASLLRNIYKIATGQRNFLIQTNTAAAIVSSIGSKNIAKILAYGDNSHVLEQSTFKTDQITMTPEYWDKQETERIELLRNTVIRSMLGLTPIEQK